MEHIHPFCNSETSAAALECELQKSEMFTIFLKANIILTK